jgi:hypothetical protein
MSQEDDDEDIIDFEVVKGIETRGPVVTCGEA